MSRIVRLQMGAEDQWKAKAARAAAVDASARRTRAFVLASRAEAASAEIDRARASIAEHDARHEQIVFEHNRDVLLASITEQMKSAGWNCACDGGHCHCNRKGS